MGGGDIVEMMRSETIYPLDLELHVNENQTRKKETVWLTAGQYEVLEIVARALDQSISKFLTETILQMLQCELEDNVVSRQLHRTKRYLSEEEWLKRRGEEKEWEKQQFEKKELEKYGVVTYSRQSTEYESDVIVIPVEIEVSSEIDAFTKNEILDEYGRDYKSWIQQCYLYRMREILTNPTEFGKVVLEEKKRDHCIQNSDLEGY